MENLLKIYLLGRLKREAKKLGVEFNKSFISSISQETKKEWAKEITSYGIISQKERA